MEKLVENTDSAIAYDPNKIAELANKLMQDAELTTEQMDVDEIAEGFIGFATLMALIEEVGHTIDSLLGNESIRDTIKDRLTGMRNELADSVNENYQSYAYEMANYVVDSHFYE